MAALEETGLSVRGGTLPGEPAHGENFDTAPRPPPPRVVTPLGVFGLGVDGESS